MRRKLGFPRFCSYIGGVRLRWQPDVNPINRIMIEVSQIVELKDEFKTPRCKKGLCFRTGRDYSKYKVIAVKRVNCIAFNLGTLATTTLRIANLKK
jgi:hypothetical protein